MTSPSLIPKLKENPVDDITLGDITLGISPACKLKMLILSLLVQWYQAALKSEWHAPSQMERDEEVDKDGDEVEGCASTLGTMPDSD